MPDTSNKQFGLLVAYVLPGFIALAGLAPIFPPVLQWLRPIGSAELGLAAPLYAVLAATAMGLILSCVRWLLLDQLHEWTGVSKPSWDDRRLDRVLGGFDYLVQNHYRYYEFTGNSFIALLFCYTANRMLQTLPVLNFGTDLLMLILLAVLFAASRDALAKYYSRTGRLVGNLGEIDLGESLMYNGNDHGGTSKKPQPKIPQQQPQSPPAPQTQSGKDASTKK